MAVRDPTWPTASNTFFHKLFLNEAINHVNIAHKSIRLIILRRLMYKFWDFVKTKNFEKKSFELEFFVRILAYFDVFPGMAIINEIQLIMDNNLYQFVELFISYLLV
jgi:hypothetical protein